MEEIILKSVIPKHYVPELQGRDDFDVKYEDNLPCPKCNRNGGQAIFYRIHGQKEWIQVGETQICYQCEEEEMFPYLEEVRKKEEKLRAERLMQKYFLIPETLKNAGFKNYEVLDSATAKAKEDAMQYVKDFLDGNYYSLLFMGSPGTGKSHLCAAIARTVKEHGYSVGFITTGEVLRKIKNTYGPGALESEETIFNDLKRLDLLILDDLGSESTGGNDDWRLAMLFEMVNSRMGKPTVYTTNFDDVRLPDAVGARVSSRLNENTKFIDLFRAEDYRKRLRVG